MAGRRGKTLEERLLALRASPEDDVTSEPPIPEAHAPVAAPIPAPQVVVPPVPAPPASSPRVVVPKAETPRPVARQESIPQGPIPQEPATARTWEPETDTLLPAGSQSDAATSAPARSRRPWLSRGSDPTIAVSPPDAPPDVAPLAASTPSRWVLAELAPVEDVPFASAPTDGAADLDASREAAPAPAEIPAAPTKISNSIFDRWLKGPKVSTVVAEPAPAPTAEVEPSPASEPEPEPVVEPAIAPEPLPASDREDLSPWERRRVQPARFGPVGATMIDRRLITGDQLDEALDIQRSSGRRVGDILVELGYLSAFELARVLADHLGVPFSDLRAKPPDPLLATLLPEEVARRYDALAIARWNDQLVIAMANPTDLFALDDLQLVTRRPIIAAMAVKEDLRAALDRAYHVSQVETTLDAAAASDHHAVTADARYSSLEVDDAPVVRLVNALMEQAITDRASDLHVEPCSTHVAIRFRIDGVLHDASEVPLGLLRPLVSRLKILSDLDIAQNRASQDGRFSVTVQGRPVDVRVVTVPTTAGESVILRLLDPERDTLDVSNLGLTPEEKARFLPPFRASQGAAFVTGPTGSGKTSTIYSVLSEINTRSKGIISVEDPVEFRLDGIKQIQINPRVGLSFPTTLRSILRADPDVVFIGEVRDAETAQIAADASITGHLVLSTLHATRAASAPMRLIEMGVEPYLVASALTMVAAQRLARKLCEHCAAPADSEVHDLMRSQGADQTMLEGSKVRSAVGCPACRGTGYLGRLPIFEILVVSEGIGRLILDRAPRADIERLAVEEGMDTLKTAALRRVARGALSFDEMMRVVS